MPSAAVAEDNKPRSTASRWRWAVQNGSAIRMGCGPIPGRCSSGQTRWTAWPCATRRKRRPWRRSAQTGRVLPPSRREAL